MLVLVAALLALSSAILSSPLPCKPQTDLVNATTTPTIAPRLLIVPGISNNTTSLHIAESAPKTANHIAQAPYKTQLTITLPLSRQQAAAVEASLKHKLAAALADILPSGLEVNLTMAPGDNSLTKITITIPQKHVSASVAVGTAQKHPAGSAVVTSKHAASNGTVAVSEEHPIIEVGMGNVGATLQDFTADKTPEEARMHLQELVNVLGNKHQTERRKKGQQPEIPVGLSFQEALAVVGPLSWSIRNLLGGI